MGNAKRVARRNRRAIYVLDGLTVEQFNEIAEQYPQVIRVVERLTERAANARTK